MNGTPTNPQQVQDTWSPYDYSNVKLQSQGTLWGRKAEVVIAKRTQSIVQTTTETLSFTGTGKGTTTSTGDTGFHFTFHVASNDMESPNLLTLKIYNLAPHTLNRIVQEFNQVTLSAGYENNSMWGLIFSGTIKQFRKGKESTTDTFLEIIAGDADMGYQYGFINTALSADAQALTWGQIYQQACRQMQVQPDQRSYEFLEQSGAFFPRGRTLFNLGRVAMRELADSVGARWSVQNGVMVVIPNNGIRPGTYVELTPDTGLVGIPQSTENGVEARILLNPNIAIGTQVGIDRSLIVQTTTFDHFFPNLGWIQDLSRVNQYRVLAIDHSGDTRGQDWYTDIVCLAAQAVADKYNEGVKNAAGGTS